MTLCLSKYLVLFPTLHSDYCFTNFLGFLSIYFKTNQHEVATRKMNWHFSTVWTYPEKAESTGNNCNMSGHICCRNWLHCLWTGSHRNARQGDTMPALRWCWADSSGHCFMRYFRSRSRINSSLPLWEVHFAAVAASRSPVRCAVGTLGVSSWVVFSKSLWTILRVSSRSRSTSFVTESLW